MNSPPAPSGAADREMHILVINSGSSSLKFALFAADDRSERRVAQGGIERIGAEEGGAWIGRGTERFARKASCQNHSTALDLAFALLAELGIERADAAGHRVVHGGQTYVQPTRVDDELRNALRRIAPLAPLHMPACIAGIEAVAKRHPAMPQVACFDTAFHANLPEVARRLPLPERFTDVRRYGFHGISFESVMSQLGADAPPRIVIAHLGNGASLVAVKDGRAIDTTMSFTPAGGIPMGTRSGDLDPGVLLYLAREKGLSFDALEELVNHESGLQAIGGVSDMKILLERWASDPCSRLAVEMFGYSVRKAIGAYAFALGGIDMLVFTGGIGEHAAKIRAEACHGLELFGIEVDANLNSHNEAIISSSASPAVVRVVKTDEELVIARHTRQLVTSAAR